LIYRSTQYETTGFVDDEFVIYNEAQQKMDYLIEFQLRSDIPSIAPLNGKNVAPPTLLPSASVTQPLASSLLSPLVQEENTEAMDDGGEEERTSKKLQDELSSLLTEESWRNHLAAEFDKPVSFDLNKRGHSSSSFFTLSTSNDWPGYWEMKSEEVACGYHPSRRCFSLWSSVL